MIYRRILTGMLIFWAYTALAQNHNQFGYMPKSVKRVFLPAEFAGQSFVLKNQDKNEVFHGLISKTGEWEHSGTSVCYADFSSFTNEGSYGLWFGAEQSGIKINISANHYNDVANALVKSFYHARVSVDIPEKYAGIYARPAGHPDNKVIIHQSAASAQRPEGTVIASSGGWYDAGDYNKYIVNSAISTFTLLHLVELYPEKVIEMHLNIPESDNNTPDVLDETIVNLRWMLSMQDPHDGGVYHKLTSKKFCGILMPAEDLSERYVVMKTTAAALDLASTAAKACRVLKPYNADYPGLADSCLQVAIKAWEWAEQHPDVYYSQPDDIKTGKYGDEKLNDEWFWSATELYLATDNNTYLKDIDYSGTTFGVPGWNNVSMLGLYSLLAVKPTEKVLYSQAKKQLEKIADKHLKVYNQSAYRISLHKFPWGSNGLLANEGLLLLHAYRLTNDEHYLQAADASAGYLLGANPLDYSFITGFGQRSPMHIHERRSEADGIEAPVPGLLVGGPSKQAQRDCGADQYPSSFPAMSYLDRECSFSTNEIAINWNAAAAFLFAALSFECSNN